MIAGGHLWEEIMAIRELAGGTVLFEIADGIATITINRPDKRNALDPVSRDAVGEAVIAVRDDRDIRALIITGAGGAFSSGGDLASIGAAEPTGQAWRQRLQDLHRWLPILLTLDRPVITAVDGVAYGAGFGLALTGDFVLASPRARFCMSFLRVGGIPDYASLHTLPRIVGPHRAREIMLSTRELSAEEALNLGIVAEIHPEDALMDRARAIAASFIGASPIAVSLIKRATLAAPAADLHTMLELEANGQSLAFTDPAHKEAIAKFHAREPLPFRWPANGKPLKS
jgi:2-(1,2-epoxy-1,2-dihydrophenyl)acetyl-CoA isomerase